jgi:hypothetical protein
MWSDFMADVTFENLLELVDRLTPQEQTRLMAHLLTQARNRPLTAAEKMQLLRAVQIDVVINEEPSPRRMDWYDDDGR